MTEVLQDIHELQADWATDAALALGRDYLDATGQIPTQEHFVAFHYNGYFDYDPASVTSGRFVDWQEFESAVAEEYDHYQQEKQAEIEGLIETIELEKQIGAIDPQLLLRFEKKDGLYRFTDKEVSGEEKVRRYFTYKVVEQLTSGFDDPDKPSTQIQDPQTRRINLVLGINIDSGKKISSTFSELSKSKTPLTVDEIAERFEFIAHEEGWLDYVEPELRTRHLEDARRASIISEALPLPADTRIYEVLSSEFYIDAKRRVLTLGKLVTGEVVSESKAIARLKKIGDLLLKKGLEVRFNDTSRHKYKEFGRDDFIKYGKWLSNILEPYGKEVSIPVLIRAFKLGLGPGPHTIINKRHFKNFMDFYINFDPARKRRIGRFDHMTDEDYIALLQNIAEQNDGKATEEIIMKRIQEDDLDEPTPRLYQLRFGSMSNAYIAAGLPPARNNKRRSIEDCLAAGVDFAESNDGNPPQTPDLKEDAELPAQGTIRKYFGSIRNYQAIIRTIIEQKQTAPINKDELLAA